MIDFIKELDKLKISFRGYDTEEVILYIGDLMDRMEEEKHKELRKIEENYKLTLQKKNALQEQVDLQKETIDQLNDRMQKAAAALKTNMTMIQEKDAKIDSYREKESKILEMYQETKETAEQIINDAKNKAKNIITDAEMQAKAIREKAQKDTEIQKEKILAEARASVQKQFKEETDRKQAALSDLDRRNEEAKSRLDQVNEELQRMQERLKPLFGIEKLKR